MNEKRNTIVKIVCSVLAVVCFVLNLGYTMGITKTVHAATDSKVQSYEAQIAQLQKDQKKYEQLMKDAEKNAASYLQQKEYLDKQLTALAEEVAVSNALLIEYQNTIAAKDEEITAKSEELNVRFDHFKDRLRTSYEEGSMGYLAMLFSSESISDFMTSLERMSNMLDYDKRTMKQINDEKATLTSEKTTLETLKAKQQTMYDDLKKSEENMEKKAAEVANYYKESANSEAVYKKKLAEAKAAEEKAAKELDAYLEELAKKHNGVYAGGPLSWPVPNNQNIVTSKFGPRTYMIWGTWVSDVHRGIDIGIPSGTSVMASADGIVEIAGWNDSYGYYVVLSHGSGYTTLYAHNTTLLVKKGQRVNRGEVIARSGSTGNSSGPHLHFEISINGKLQDPLANGILSHPALVIY